MGQWSTSLFGSDISGFPATRVRTNVMAMDFLSAGRAGQIAEILQRETLAKAQGEAWAEAVARIDEKIVEKVVEVATTWALLMQHTMRTQPSRLSVAAKLPMAAEATVGETLQYCTVSGKSVSLIMSRVIPLLSDGWEHGAPLAKWLKTNEGKKLLMR